MTLIQCECGTKLDMGRQAGRVTCPGCGKRFTVAGAAPEAGQAHSPRPACAGGSPEQPGPLSRTMMYDLPALTEFQSRYGDSIIVSAQEPSVAWPLAGGQPGDAAALSAAPAVSAAAAWQSGPGSAVRSSPPPAAAADAPDTRPGRAQATELRPGLRLLARYEILRTIGQGGMSTVYEAYDEVREENVALKVLPPHLAARPQLQERFLLEGRLSSSFSHANIARVYDLHQTDSMILLSMELLHGATLRHDMNRRKDQRQTYRPAEVLAMMQHICQALQVVHAENVVHRDLKPENLWLGLDGSVKIMDFGIARDSSGTAFTTGGRGSGTPYYIAPEQLAASPTLDHRADQYSLAVIMYELLTGELPQGAFVAPHVKNPAVPRKMSKAVFRALSADPSQRYPHIRAFYEAARFRTRTSPLTKALLGVCVLVLLGAGGFAFARWAAPLWKTEASPVWANVPPQNVVEGKPLRFAVRHPQCTIPERALSFKLLADAPAGTEIKDGQLVWTPSEAQGPKQHSFAVMAVVREEGKPERIDERKFVVDVAEQFDKPSVPAIEPVAASEHQPLSMPIKAEDVNQPPLGLRFELRDGPSGMVLDPESGQLEWVPGEEHGGNKYDVVVRVCLQGDEHRRRFTEQAFQVVVQESIDAPRFTSPEVLNAAVGQAVSFHVTAWDGNTPQIPDFFRLQGAPDGMTVDASSGQVFWTPGADHAGKEFAVTVQLCLDAQGRVDVLNTQSLKVRVAELNEAREPTPSSPVPDVLPGQPGAAQGNKNCEKQPRPGGPGNNNCPKQPRPGGPGGNNNCQKEPRPGGVRQDTLGTILDVVDRVQSGGRQESSAVQGAPGGCTGNGRKQRGKGQQGGGCGSGGGKQGQALGQKAELNSWQGVLGKMQRNRRASQAHEEEEAGRPSTLLQQNAGPEAWKRVHVRFGRR